MRWTERQRAMLREMGIVFWWREAAGGDDSAGTDAPGKAGADSDRPEARHAERRAEGRPGFGAYAGSPTPMPATGGAGPSASLAAAEWLAVGDAFASADATGADQERLLDNMLGAIGVSRTAPTRNGRAAYVGLPEASGGAQSASAASLDAAIAVVQPACILALGRAAAQAVLDTDEPLGALRGRRETRAGVPVIVTFAPAFLLRHPVDKAKAWADLCLAVRSLEETA